MRTRRDRRRGLSDAVAEVVEATSQISLVGLDDPGRRDLARYLTGSGFEVRQAEPPPCGTETTRFLIWLTERDDNPLDTADAVERWLGAAPARRAIVVTWRPAAFRAASEAYGARLAVLVAPVFGWQVSDALRSTNQGGPP
jgi:hypothetical protein